MSYMYSKFRDVAPALVDQRMAVRHAVYIERASVARETTVPLPAILEDISIYGCRVIVDGEFAAHDRVLLRLADNDPITATAIWYEAGKLGCRFDAALESKLFRTLTLNSN